jgi:hypothetical protein
MTEVESQAVGTSQHHEQMRKLEMRKSTWRALFS